MASSTLLFVLVRSATLISPPTQMPQSNLSDIVSCCFLQQFLQARLSFSSPSLSPSLTVPSLFNASSATTLIPRHSFYFICSILCRVLPTTDCISRASHRAGQPLRDHLNYCLCHGICLISHPRVAPIPLPRTLCRQTPRSPTALSLPSEPRLATPITVLSIAVAVAAPVKHEAYSTGLISTNTLLRCLAPFPCRSWPFVVWSTQLVEVRSSRYESSWPVPYLSSLHTHAHTQIPPDPIAPTYYAPYASRGALRVLCPPRRSQ